MMICIKKNRIKKFRIMIDTKGLNFKWSVLKREAKFRIIMVNFKERNKILNNGQF